MKLFRQMSNLQAQKYSLFKLESSLFSNFNIPAYSFLDDAYGILLHNRKVI